MSATALRRGLPLAVLAAMPVLLAVAVALHPLLEPDVFWHLASGRWILEHGQVPRTDVLTWTMADRAWTNFQWLFDVALVSAWRFGGADALILLNAVVLATVAALLVRAGRAAGAGATAAALAAAMHVLASAERTTIRPESVSCVAIAVLVTLVEIVRHGGPRRWLAVAPFVTALWINFHSLAFLGPCLLLWHAAIAAMERTCAGRSEDGAPAGLARDLFLAGAASSLALLANPYGIAAWTFPLTLFQRVGAERDVFARILEFARPLDDPFDPALRWFWAMLAALVASFAALGRRASVGRAAAVIPFLALALLARRNVPLFSIVAAPALAANLAALGRRATAGPAPLRALAAGGPMLAIAGLAGFAAAVLAGASPTLLGLPRERGLGLQPGLFPEDCLASLERLGAKGRLFNDLDFGGYVEWRSPDRPAFVDARLEVAGADRLAEIIAAHESPAGWERLRARWNPEILLLQHSSRGSAALLRSLLASGEWVPTCFSPEAALLVARALSPGAPVRPSADGWEEILAEARAPEPLAGRSLALVTEPLDRLLRPSPAPSAVRRAMRLANLHLTLDDPTAARGGYSAVLAVAPADPEALFNLGLCELRLGRRDEARRIWEDGLARVDRGSRAIFRRGIDELLRP